MLGMTSECMATNVFGEEAIIMSDSQDSNGISQPSTTQNISEANDAVMDMTTPSDDNPATSHCGEVLQSEESVVTSSDDVPSNETQTITFDGNLDSSTTFITSTEPSDQTTTCHDLVTTTVDTTLSQPQTLYVAIQPPAGTQSNGEVSEDQPAVYVEVVEASNLAGQLTTDGQMIIAEQSVSGEQTIPASLLTHVVDQATLNTMQAEMIAVQVLSQSATGDVQFFQQQANTQVVPVSTFSGVDLQNTLSQAGVSCTPLTITLTQPATTSTVPFPGSDQITAVTTMSTDVVSTEADVSNDDQPAVDEETAEGEDLPTVVAEDAEDGDDDDKPKYTCEICNKSYIRSWSYYGHMREHSSGEKQHKCDVCEKVFNYGSNLRQHMLIHTGEKPYECEYCEKAFNNPSSLRSHMLSHSEDKPYSCDHEGCDKAFNNPGSLRVHRRVHQDEKPFQCTQDCCDKAFKTPAELSRHMFRHTGEKPHKCDMCEKAFIRYDDLKRHYRIHTGEKPFKCDQCDFACIQSFDLVKHKYTHTGDKPYKCELCIKQFTRPARLRDHMRTHTGEKPFTCEECGKSFSVQTGLKSHMAVHTGEKPFKCGECERSFRTQQEVQAHMGRHTGVKPFKCNLCHKEFISAVTFKRHAIVHSGEKPFQCDECGRRFARATDLKVHLPVHSEDKPYKCGECEKMFTRFSTLKEHLRTHTGERPFKCDSCGRQFNHRSHFNNHLRIHTGEKPFKCEKCGKLFSRKASVRYHMKVHGIDGATATVGNNTSTVARSNTSQQQPNTTVDHEQVTAGHIMSQLTNEADVQLAEVLVAVSDALVAANQEQLPCSEDQVHHLSTDSTVSPGGTQQQLNQQQQSAMEAGDQSTIETDMNADQTVSLIANGNSAGDQILANAQVIDAQLTEAQIMEVSGITSMQTSEGHVITVNVSEDGHVIDPSQLQALGVIAEAAKANPLQIPEILAAAAASGVNVTDDVAHLVAVSTDSGQQAQVVISQAMQQEVVSGGDEQPMDTS